MTLGGAIIAHPPDPAPLRLWTHIFCRLLGHCQLVLHCAPVCHPIPEFSGGLTSWQNWGQLYVILVALVKPLVIKYPLLLECSRLGSNILL